MVRLILNFLLVGCLLLGYSTASDAKNYKFRNENGKLHFTNDTKKVPEKYRKDSSKKPTQGNSSKNKISQSKVYKKTACPVKENIQP